MSKRRNIGTVAALGGLTAVVALITASPSARADELADLRANQELLQRRVDQLAQLPPPAFPEGPRASSFAGSFPRSWLIPGTETSMKIGGNIYMDVVHYFAGGQANQQPQSNNTTTNGNLNALPLKGTNARSRGNNIWQFTPNRTNINFETRTPTVLGEARTFLEWDFSSNAFSQANTHNTNNLGLRLRFAYATVGGLLAGQANSNFGDPDASMEVLSFGGMQGDPGPSRVPQVRYTMPLAPWGVLGSLSISAEAPETDAQDLGGVIESDVGAATSATCTAAVVGVAPACTLLRANPFKTTAPDVTAAWYIPQPWGHFDFSAVVRPDLQINDGLFVRRDFVGYGAHIGMDIKPGWFGWAKDDITFHVVGGDGIGRYGTGNTTYFSLASNYPVGNALPVVTTPAAAAAIRVSTTPEYGGNIGYQHHWTPEIRSNIGFGATFHDIPAFVGAGQRAALNKMEATGLANVIWAPVSFVQFGLEYAYGYRKVVNGNHGDAHSLQWQTRVRF